MKRILFLCQFFYPENNSSATLPFDTATCLAANGFSVDVLCGMPKEYNNNANVPQTETIKGINICRLDYIQLSRGTKAGRLINYFSFTFSVLCHVHAFKKYDDIVVYSNPPILPIVPVIAHRLFGTKVVFVAYDVYPEVAYASGTLRQGDLIDNVMQHINGLIYKRASMIVALTDEMRDFLLAHRPQLTEDRVITIENWAHEEHEERVEFPTEACSYFGCQPDQFVVAYIGNMGICQDMETLLNAMKELADDNKVHFLFAGHGSKKERVESLIRDDHIKNAQVAGFLTGNTLQEALSVSSCCVVSLEKGLKGMCAPSKYYSYLHAGKPVVAIVEEGSYLWKEIHSENIGCAVRIGDVEGLKTILVDLADTPERAKQMGRNARLLYERKYAKDVGLLKYVQMMQKMQK